MRSRIDEEIIERLDDTIINIVVFDVTNTSIDFYEFEILLKNIIELNEKFIKKYYNKISAIVMLEGKYSKNFIFKGLINPLNQKKIADDIKKLFNLKEIEIPKQY